MTSIFNAASELVRDEKEVQEEFLRFCDEILGTSEPIKPIDPDIISNGPVLTQEQGDALYMPVTNLEIRDAIFYIPSSKSPGPDGFTSGLYKATWHIIGDEVCSFIKDFFLHYKLLRENNTTMITLVPKITCPKVVGDYRPIACCNIIYKAITKIITLRLQTVMGDLVDIAQGAFIKDRAIVDNVLVCQGLVRDYNKPTGPSRCLMKLDLKKAYDMLNWQFIEDVLRRLQFPQKFIDWVMICIKTPKFSLLINGSPVGFFASKRGVRQGDPMSPYIFVLAIEYLSRSLKKLKDCPDFAFHPKCRSIQLIHLAFADDLIMVCKADLKSPLLLKKYYDDFSEVSGLRINNQKSHIFLGAAPPRIKHVLLNQLGFA